jgi:hypothetical protein
MSNLRFTVTLAIFVIAIFVASGRSEDRLFRVPESVLELEKKESRELMDIETTLATLQEQTRIIAAAKKAARKVKETDF